jgi:SAM-dependent MidA family methyltransferase
VGGGAEERIRGEIARCGPIPFARFMELALYDPAGGYYAAGSRGLGRGGDYVTASDAGRAFGRCLARQLAEIDRRIGPLDPFHCVEFGAGRGLLGRDVLDAMPGVDANLARRLQYVMVDRSAGMRAEAGGRVPEALVVAPEDLGGGHLGAAVAIELFDALPVHRVRRRSGRLVEVQVDLDGDRLVEREGPPGAEVRILAERYAAAREEGQEAEVSPEAARQVDALARCLARGVILIVDYGDDAAGLYGGTRPQGTLLAYHAHVTSRDYLARVGSQDLTAHVNFTLLEDRARALGLATLGRTTQDRFLLANGIAAEFEPPPAHLLQDPRAAKRRLQALHLIHPQGMGRAFRVLAFCKGCDPPPPLDGLRDPFARDQK